MKKSRIVAFLLAAMVVLSLVGCGDGGATATSDGGKVFNIYAWNEEFKGFFEKYYQVPEGVTVNWVINPSDGGVYQQKLDEALAAQATAAADEKVDMFLAEADYILKYVNSDVTTDIKKIGVTDFSNTYAYTVEACTDTNGVVKGVSFQCCPSALIYRRSIAMDVLGTDDPAEVQAALSDWAKFDAVAADAKAKGYYMIGSFASTYRPFSNNVSKPWVDANGKLQMDANIDTWIKQIDNYVANGYCLTSGIWDDETTAQMFADGKTMCFFGPAWYFNFSMGNAQDPEKGCYGDWAICQGPMAHFWGGTWLLAASGTDNSTMVADIMNKFINDEDVCSKLVENEAQFSNNQAVNQKYATDDSFGNAFLRGQNAVALFSDLAKNIKFQNMTVYDQLCNEGLQGKLEEYWKGACSYEDAMANFKTYISETYPEVSVN